MIKNLISDDLKYWLSKSPEERVAAVDYLRPWCPVRFLHMEKPLFFPVF